MADNAGMSQLKVMVLAGGPDREREVSLKSGAAVAAALREAGHVVKEADIRPGQLGALDDFEDWQGDVIFPALHGPWGEGGPLQQLLDEFELPYVGCRAAAAETCMDKAATKAKLREMGVPTPDAETLSAGDPAALTPPVVVKPAQEGSSIGLTICNDEATRDAAVAELASQYERCLVERFIVGREMTVGVIENNAGRTQALPPIHIVPAVAFYDYEAKYQRDDTQYRFDIDLPAAALDELKRVAARAFDALGCRHMSRVDFIVDADDRAWVLEINTIPGFTTHSLLPKAAAHAGMPLPRFVDHLVRLAAADA